MSLTNTTPEWVGIGTRIRGARKEARLSVRELARRMSVSPSHVSQVERGLASFSVRALYNVTNVLDISMDSLFEDGKVPAEVASPPTASGRQPAEDDPLVDSLVVMRASQRPTISLEGDTRWERLTPKPEIAAEFIEVIYAPHAGGTPVDEFIRHSSREYGIVIQGSLSVQVAFDRAVLNPGDSIAFDSSTPHRFWNDTAEEVRAIWFISDGPDSGKTPELGTEPQGGRHS